MPVTKKAKEDKKTPAIKKNNNISSDSNTKKSAFLSKKDKTTSLPNMDDNFEQSIFNDAHPSSLETVRTIPAYLRKKNKSYGEQPLYRKFPSFASKKEISPDPLVGEKASGYNTSPEKDKKASSEKGKKRKSLEKQEVVSEKTSLPKKEVQETKSQKLPSFEKKEREMRKQEKISQKVSSPGISKVSTSRIFQEISTLKKEEVSQQIPPAKKEKQEETFSQSVQKEVSQQTPPAKKEKQEETFSQSVPAVGKQKKEISQHTSLIEKEKQKKEISQHTSLVENRKQEEKISQSTPSIENEKQGKITSSERNKQKEFLQTELKKVKQQLTQIQGNNPIIPTYVDRHTIASVISDWTDIPIDKMLINEIDTILNINQKMAERIVGQSQAIELIANSIQNYQANLDNDSHKFTGVFLLVGPSGVGKTETAIALADIIYGSERHLVTVNMSEYQENSTIPSLIGIPSHIGKEGILIEAVRRNPYCVILLKEIEKAHPSFFKLFYQLFDKAIKDAAGLTVSFKNTIILLTSTVGTKIITGSCKSLTASPNIGKIQKAIRPELLQYFSSVFLNRLTIIPYCPLGKTEIYHIVEQKLVKVQQRFQEKHHAKLTFDENVVNAIVKCYTGTDADTYNVDSFLTDTLLPTLSVEILERMANQQIFTAVHLNYDKKGNLHYQFDSVKELPLPEKPKKTQEILEIETEDNPLTPDNSFIPENLKIETEDNPLTPDNSLTPYTCHELREELNELLESLNVDYE
ncbi:AAA family ATPase [Candidatus Parabeggiatoa sp. HSG14]|uniref:AAA family ATPase n=1 Tax=Candidatus Parabeggiatoa sp. HSG14 TaxID=3055593 RepID=UPI0025A6F634|nr:AAA family ATPase [Thiotrichales bacterium HSG14]